MKTNLKTHRIISAGQILEKSRGLIFTCTDKTEKECFDRMLFSTNKIYAEKVLQVETGDTLFLLNLDSDTLYGTLRAKSEGKKDIIPAAWGCKYPYQVQVEKEGKVKIIENAKKLLTRMGISWKNMLSKNETKLLISYMENPDEFDWNEVKLNKSANLEVINEKPLVEATTL